MESHIYDISESISSKLYELNALIMRTDQPHPLANLMPGADQYHPMVRSHLFG
jgi:hypothetical protein